jgi:hypothetical protein
MAVINSQSVVLRGVNVVNGVVTGMTRRGFNPAVEAPSAGSLSYQRHLSLGAPQAGLDPWARHERAAFGGGGHAAPRAGRPGSPAGVPVKRPARSAGRAILSGWPQASGVASPTAAWCQDRLTILPKALTGARILPGRSQISRRAALPAGSLTSLPRLERSGKRREGLSAMMPALRMPRVSLRGK